MKYHILSILAIGLLFLSSCNKESISYDDEKYSDIELREGDLMDKRECFQLEYPLTIVFPDGSTYTGANQEEIRTQIKSWYEANPDIKEKPSLAYPVTVTFDGNKSKFISSEEQMMRLKKYCREKLEKERKVCFRLIYPVTYQLPDGSTITGEDARDMRAQLKVWYEANPDAEEKPVLSYPVDVKFKNGSVKSIANEEEMIALKKRCNDRESDGKECFQFVFPIQYEMPDGTTIDINDKSEFESSIKAWYEANPDNKEKPNLLYPVEVEFADGTTKAINNEEELITLKKRCEDK